MDLFGNLFDLNRDGELDGLEKAIGFGVVMSILEEEEESEDDSDDFELVEEK